VLRIELGPEDIGRVRFAAAPAPVLETVLMLAELRRRPHRPAAPGDWRTLVQANFPGSARPLLDLAPAGRLPAYLDVLTADAEEAFAAVHDTATSLHAANVARVEALTGEPVPRWLRRYADGDPVLLRAFDRALRSYHTACLAPQWRTVVSRFHHDVARRSAVARDLGVTAMLATLGPGLRLNGHVLEGRYPRERHVRPDGRGLVLMPSAFWTGHPLVTWDPLDPDRHVLIYPAHAAPDRRLPPPTGDADPAGALTVLLGATRAATLTALSRPRTTTGIAQHLGISPSTASEHTAALRDASLVESHRTGKSVEHRLTPLGLALLHQAG
jgi:DNA-binding transcriptional ArsR family regulator